MNFEELITKRRSIRKFQDKSVENVKIETLLRTLLKSPSGKRKNPWEFVVVNEKETLKELSKCKIHGSKLLNNSPLAIIVIGNPNESDTWIEDCSIASIILQLQALDLGLGSCWVQVDKRQHSNNISSDEFVKNLVGIPDSRKVLSIIALGYPDEAPHPFDDEKLQMEKIKYEKY